MSEKREPASANVFYTILRLAVDIAPGRVEETIFFSKNWHSVPNFREKVKEYHAAAGESGRLSRQTPGLEPTAHAKPE